MTAATTDVWLVSLNDATREDLALHVRALSDDERARAGRYARTTDALAFAKTRAVLRRLLAERLGISAADVRLAEDRLGRPRLAGEASLAFSVSHSAPYAAIAIANSHDVGIDIETWQPVDAAELGADVFAPEELARIHSAPNRIQSLYGHWTRKEAVVKLQGVGLGGSLKALLMTPGVPQWFGDICVQDIPVPGEASAALAVMCANGRSVPTFTLRTL